MNDHFVPVGKPAPPRPRSPESLTVAITVVGRHRQRLAQRLVAVVALVGRQGPGFGVVPVAAEHRGQRRCSVARPSVSSASSGVVGPVLRSRLHAVLLRHPQARQRGRPAPPWPSSGRWSGRPARMRDVSRKRAQRSAAGGCLGLTGPQRVDEFARRVRCLVVEELPVDHHHRARNRRRRCTRCAPG